MSNRPFHLRSGLDNRKGPPVRLRAERPLPSAHVSKPVRLFPLLVVTLAIAGCALLPSSGSSGQRQAGPTPTPIPAAVVPAKPTYTVQRGEVVRELEFSGRIGPVATEELSFRTDGRVGELLVEAGDPITAGQLVASLEIDELERELVAAQLAHESAEARLERAEQQLAYDTRRAEVNLEIAQLRLEQARAASANPEADPEVAIKEREVELAAIALEELENGADPELSAAVERAAAQVEALEEAAADARIVAPFDGQVLSVEVAEGDTVDALRPVIVVADPTELEVHANLISSQMQELAEGMPAVVAPSDRPGEALPGMVRRLPYPYGQGDSGTDARVGLEEPAREAGLELGDVARVTVLIERRDDVLWLPPQAVRTFDGRDFVVVQEGEAQRRVDVKVGTRGNDRVEIVEGIDAGQTVVGP